MAGEATGEKCQGWGLGEAWAQAAVGGLGIRERCRLMWTCPGCSPGSRGSGCGGRQPSPAGLGSQARALGTERELGWPPQTTELP